MFEFSLFKKLDRKLNNGVIQTEKFYTRSDLFISFRNRFISLENTEAGVAHAWHKNCFDQVTTLKLSVKILPAIFISLWPKF